MRKKSGSFNGRVSAWLILFLLAPLLAKAQVITESGPVSTTEDLGTFTVTATSSPAEPDPFPMFLEVGAGWKLNATISGEFLPVSTTGFAFSYMTAGFQSEDGGSIPEANGGAISLTNTGILNWTKTAGGSLLASGGIQALSFGADGYEDETDHPTSTAVYNGANGGAITIIHDGDLSVTGTNELISIIGIDAVSYGGDGAVYHDNAGSGGNGGAVAITTEAGSTISIANGLSLEPAIGIHAESQGGAAGVNSDSSIAGSGGAVSVTHGGNIENAAMNGIGILAESYGGTSTTTEAGQNFSFGGAVSVTLQSNSTLQVTGNSGIGVFAASAAGDSSADSAFEHGDNVNVTIAPGASIVSGNSNGQFSMGVLAASAGTASALNPFAAMEDAPNGSGTSGAVTVTNNGSVLSQGTMSIGIAALSIGGGGIVANASGSGNNTLGALESAFGATSSSVTVTNTGSIQTSGLTAHGIVAISTGNGGLLNNSSSGLLFIGSDGSGDTASPGGSITINESGQILTSGQAAIGIVAQSIGGGGGTGGGTQAGFQLGDQGGGGGHGGLVNVTLDGNYLQTQGDVATGVLVQSIGGGGGNGANGHGFFVAVGGSGGSGGDGGDINFNFDSGQIETLGDYAPGVVAQSIGGGGGNGGSAKAISDLFSGSIGGSGGDGGSGQTVNAYNYAGSITTLGNQSAGMLGQSVGGGGGTGGAASSHSFGFLTISVALGGSGGKGGDGETVNLLNQGSITTGIQNNSGVPGPNPIGADSIGMIAQSIGGGGGHGGAATAKALTLPAEEVPSLAFTIAIGGTGGDGGIGGTVGVENDGTITTYGDGSHGILAQSIGGGGGNGGDSTAAATLIESETPSAKIAIAMGGSAGSGANGGAVTVYNGAAYDAAIFTTGQNAAGILAQSIGGGGGNGGAGNASSGSPNLGGDVGTAVNLQIGIGGVGGSGNDGGTVNVTNYSGSSITTMGSGSQGILAQSIGGGGGNAGGGSAAGTGDTVNLNVSIGGSGGTSGNGEDVTVVNDGIIATSGGDAVGILAQSIGGGGGTGGTSDATASINTVGQIENLLNAPGKGYEGQVSIGGSGGAGGDGRPVDVTNNGQITTQGARAYGLLAQSIGGGGGSGGTATSSSNSADTVPDDNSDPDSSATYSANVALGGSGGSAGNAESLQIVNDGLIQTAGYSAHGILAQSIGGGGGAGGEGTVNATTSVNIGAGITESNGAAGNGDTVTITNSGTIQTTGEDASGIVAQSIGGGGGSSSTGSPFFNVQASKDSAEVQINLGSSNSSSGDGDTVSVTHLGQIGTAGDWAHGILAQSIGGGGGKSATHSNGIEADLEMALQPIGSEGDGGDVNITLEGSIATSGFSSFGILAQSIGGGGGLATDGSVASSGKAVIGGVVASGDGGDLSLTGDSGSVTTSGYGAHAVVLQSVGGGGGIAGAGSSAGGPSVLNLSNGGNYGDGDGGDITAYLENVTIITTGENAHGLVVQSIGGGGGFVAGGEVYGGSLNFKNSSAKGGKLEITQGGTISATGENSVGIFAQSTGAGGSDSISITVNGAVQGGSGNGAGIWMVDGDSYNNITVNGSLGASSGAAVVYTGGDGVDVVNNGQITGSLELGDGTFTNNATYIVGSDAVTAKTAAGSGNRPRKGGGFERAIVDGDFVQTSEGTIVVRTDFNRGKGDLLHIKGDAKLDGKIVTVATSVAPLVQIPVVKVDGKISRELEGQIAGVESSIFSYGVERAGKQFLLGVNAAHFTPSGVHLATNQREVANHLESIWDAGGNKTFGELFAVLGATASARPGDYVGILQQLSPGSTLAFAARRTADMQAFSDSVLSYPRFAGQGTTLVEGDYTWGRMDGQTARQESSNGFRLNTLTWQVGGQKEIAPGWFVGGAAAFESSWLNANDGFSSGSGQGGQGAITVKYQTEPWLFEGAVFGSFGFYDTNRSINVPGFGASAEGSPAVQSAGFTLRASYTHGTERFYLRPNLTINTIYVHSGAYTEDGAGALNLAIEEGNETTFIATPGLEIGARFDLPNSMVLRTFLSGSVSVLTNDSWNQRARFAGAPAAADSVITSIPIDDVVARVSLGAQLKVSERVDVFLQYNGEFSNNLKGNGGAFGATWWF